MKQRVATLPPGATALDAARLMREQGCGLIPICDHLQNVLGVVTDRDLVLRVCAEQRSLESTKLESVMTRQVVACAPHDLITHAEELMCKRHLWRLVVLDGQKLVGLLSLTDVAHTEEPLKLARVVREVTSREFRVE